METLGSRWKCLSRAIFPISKVLNGYRVIRFIRLYYDSARTSRSAIWTHKFYYQKKNQKKDKQKKQKPKTWSRIRRSEPGSGRDVTWSINLPAVKWTWTRNDPKAMGCISMWDSRTGAGTR